MSFIDAVLLYSTYYLSIDRHAHLHRERGFGFRWHVRTRIPFATFEGDDFHG